MFAISVNDVCDALRKQKCGKACGPDDISMKAIMYGGHRLCIHICFLFNLFIRCGYLPKAFMMSVIIPVVKNTCGDLAEKITIEPLQCQRVCLNCLNVLY